MQPAAPEAQNKPTESRVADTEDQDVLFLRSSGKRLCRISSIDSQNVVLEGGELINRFQIHSIQFRNK